MTSLGDGFLILLEKDIKFSLTRLYFIFYSERAFELILFFAGGYAFSQAFQIFRIFEVTEIYEVYRLLQTGLFLTDSVFVELVACFDETMVSIGGY